MDIRGLDKLKVYAFRAYDSLVKLPHNLKEGIGKAVLDGIRRFSPETFEQYALKSHVYGQVESNCRRLAGELEKKEEIIGNLETRAHNLNGQVESSVVRETGLVNNIGTLSAQVKELHARNIQYASDSIGDSRRIRELENGLATSQKHAEKLERGLRVKTREHYDSGIYEKTPALLLSDGKVILQNRAARDLVGGTHLTGLNLTDFISLEKGKHHYAKLNGVTYDFQVFSLSGAMGDCEVKFEKAGRFYQKAEDIMGVPIREIILPKGGLATT